MQPVYSYSCSNMPFLFSWWPILMTYHGIKIFIATIFGFDSISVSLTGEGNTAWQAFIWKPRASCVLKSKFSDFRKLNRVHIFYSNSQKSLKIATILKYTNISMVNVWIAPLSVVTEDYKEPQVRSVLSANLGRNFLFSEHFLDMRIIGKELWLFLL